MKMQNEPALEQFSDRLISLHTHAIDNLAHMDYNNFKSKRESIYPCILHVFVCVDASFSESSTFGNSEAKHRLVLRRELQYRDIFLSILYSVFSEFLSRLINKPIDTYYYKKN